MANVKFGGNPVNLIGTQVKVGDNAPAFELVKNDLSAFKSDELKGKVVIYSVVPVPKIPAKLANIAKVLPSHFHWGPMPFSI